MFSITEHVLTFWCCCCTYYRQDNAASIFYYKKVTNKYCLSDKVRGTFAECRENVQLFAEGKGFFHLFVASTNIV